MPQAQLMPFEMASTKYRPQAIVACAGLAMEEVIVRILREVGLQPLISDSLEEIETLLTEEETVMVFCQLKLGSNSFQEVLKAADNSRAKVPVIVCSESYDEDLYIDVMSLGAFEYLAFPHSREDVEWVVNNAMHWGPLLCGTQRRQATCSSVRSAS